MVSWIHPGAIFVGLGCVYEYVLYVLCLFRSSLNCLWFCVFLLEVDSWDRVLASSYVLKVVQHAIGIRYALNHHLEVQANGVWVHVLCIMSTKWSSEMHRNEFSQFNVQIITLRFIRDAAWVLAREPIRLAGDLVVTSSIERYSSGSWPR